VAKHHVTPNIVIKVVIREEDRSRRVGEISGGWSSLILDRVLGSREMNG